MALHFLVQSRFPQVHPQIFLNDRPAHCLLISQSSCLRATLETSREDGLQRRAFISFFLSSVDKRRQTQRFTFGLILPRSHREFGLINGLLRAKKKGIKSERKERKTNGRWAKYLWALQETDTIAHSLWSVYIISIRSFFSTNCIIRNHISPSQRKKTVVRWATHSHLVQRNKGILPQKNKNRVFCHLIPLCVLCLFGFVWVCVCNSTHAFTGNKY